MNGAATAHPTREKARPTTPRTEFRAIWRWSSGLTEAARDAPSSGAGLTLIRRARSGAIPDPEPGDRAGEREHSGRQRQRRLARADVALRRHGGVEDLHGGGGHGLPAAGLLQLRG